MNNKPNFKDFLKGLSVILVLYFTLCAIMYLAFIVKPVEKPTIIREVIIQKTKPPNVPKQVVKQIPLGTFKITYYTIHPRCTPNSRGITASGAHVYHNITVAVDPKIIPLGTYIYIEGIGFRVAQDTGSAVKGHVIDVYVNTLEETRHLYHRKVYIIKEVNK